MKSPNVEWLAATRSAILDDGKVHVWRVDPSDYPYDGPSFIQILSQDERSRADKYHFEKDRHDFLIRRGMLRVILASYLDLHPANVRFAYNEFDKPAIDVETLICFNASFSKGLGIIVITLGSRIGVDIEFVDAAFPKLEIAERYFSTDEVLAIRDLPPGLQTTAFFDCWTKKEAFIKAMGEGMSRPLPDLAVSLERPNSVLVTAAHNTEGWRFVSFVPDEGYIAALAHEGGQREISYFRWQTS